MPNYREKMREYLKEPNEYSSQYGKWGILNVEQRQLIKRLLDEMDNADVVIKNQYEEKQQLIKFLEDKIKNYEEDVENSKPYLEHKELFQQVQNDIHTSKCIITNLKDVLDFINKGGKDE